MENSQSNRRSFIKTTALGALGTITAPMLLGSCSNSASKEEQLKDVIVPEIFLGKAPDGRPLKAGLVGCGYRGSGAGLDFLAAGNGLQLTALGDTFQDKIDEFRATLKEKGHEIADENCFVGFDSCKKVVDSGVDVVLLCNPPIFRPDDFDYVVEKGKHCFMEKPCATDPTGIRQILMAAKRATSKGLSVVTGTVLRSQRDVVETYRRVAGGAIGEIVSAHVALLIGAIWDRKRRPGWSDMEYLIRNWPNFYRTSGDHIVEQFVHDIDAMRWFMGEAIPVSAEAMGCKQRRVTGDIYDQFSVNYVFENGIRAHCTTRQIDGCDFRACINIYGTKGYTDLRRCQIFNYDGSVAWSYPRPKPEDPDQTWAVPNRFEQEQVRLVNAIRTGKPINEAEQLAYSTLTAIMGRESAYSGKFITWNQMMASDQNLKFEKTELGDIPGFKEGEVPIPGTPPKV